MKESLLILDEKVIKRNYGKIVKVAKKTICVLKANAYNHGDEAVFSALLEEGADAFAVANLSEGVRLKTFAKEAEKKVDVYILGFVAKSDYSIAREYDLIVPIVSTQHYRQIADLTHLPPLYVQVDTGMNRLGIDYRDGEINAIVKAAKEKAKNGFYGLWSHLFASSDDDICAVQAKRLKGVCGAERVSLSASEAVNKDFFLGERKRAGISLYGYGRFAANFGLKPPLTLKTFLIRVKKVFRGESVGYAPPYIVKTDCFIGTAPIGYADGIMRSYVGGKVYVLGRECEIVAVCMDMIMIKLDCVAKAGDAVVVFSKEGNLERLTNNAGTIVYEGLTALGTRLKRVVKK